MNGQNVKDNTVDFYNNNAQVFVEQTLSVDMQALYKPFIASLPATNQSQQRILDLGCGSGRDSLYFAQLGFHLTAIDGSAALIDVAQKNINRHPIEWYQLTFEEIPSSNWQERFTGIWACASLLHVPYTELPVLIDDLLGMLTDKGVFYASFKYGDSERFKDNRFFCDMNEQRWVNTVSNMNTTIDYDVWLSKDCRPKHAEQWFNIIIKRRHFTAHF